MDIQHLIHILLLFLHSIIPTEGIGELAERLDRFTLSNILLQSSSLNHSKEVSTLATNLSKIPAGWWVKYPDYNENVWDVLKDLIRFVISYRKKLESWDSAPGNLRLTGHEASVLAANQAAHHLAHHAGSHWESFLKDCYKLAYVTDDWLKKIGSANVQFLHAHFI